MKEEEILNGSLLFFLVKLDEDDKLSGCDGELNENYGWSYEDSYEDSYLLTRNEIISLKEKLGDKIVFLKDDMADYEEFVKGKYHVIPADDIIGEWWEASDWDSPDDEIRRLSASDCNFWEAMDKKYGNWMGWLWDKSLEHSRIVREVFDKIVEIEDEEYDKWIMEQK